MDLDRFPDAHQLAGRYRVIDDRIEVDVTVFKGDEEIGTFTVSGPTADLSAAAQEIRERTEKMIGVDPDRHSQISMTGEVVVPIAA